ncbi:MAG: NAD-dependent epimerase/dehydratase family protein, partial [Firmicutes bacterium]|nr:NAD-dependent epimerase/dehydratase family protein [Bacillota bacterium]
MRKAVVTGAGGFIGSHLVEALLRQGDAVVGIDSMGPPHAAGKEANLRAAQEAR